MADEKKPAAAKEPAKKEPAPEVPQTPSGLALDEVGTPPELTSDNQEDVLEHAAAYEAAKRKHRWG